MFYINTAFCSYLQFTQYPNIFGTEVVTYHIYIYLKYLKKKTAAGVFKSTIKKNSFRTIKHSVCDNCSSSGLKNQCECCQISACSLNTGAPQRGFSSAGAAAAWSSSHREVEGFWRGGGKRRQLGTTQVLLNSKFTSWSRYQLFGDNQPLMAFFKLDVKP